VAVLPLFPCSYHAHIAHLHLLIVSLLARKNDALREVLVITNALLYNQKAAQHPDLVSCVFHAKLHSLIYDIKNGVLGDINGYLYTIEFQKRGLPQKICYLENHAD
jgi:Helitron helicase-like domain at N-terminus